MKIFYSKILLLTSTLMFVHGPFSFAACNCGSKDAGNPCTGQSISVTVNANSINGAGSRDATFNWAFNSGGGDARCGQFANGDYWVAPAAGQSTVSITSITGSGSITADADPVMESMGLLNGVNSYGNRTSEQNIIPNLPLSYSATTSLVAAIQRNEAVEGNCGTPAIVGECVDSYNVVTVLPSVPANAGSTVIRPNITGNSKSILSFTDFDFSRLPSKNYISGKDANGYEAIRQRWSHSTEIFGLVTSAIAGGTFSEGGRAFRSHILIDNYASGVARQWNDDMMVLFSDDNSLSEKKAALAAMLAYGLDLYNAMYNSGVTRYWGTGAGQHLGKVMPPLFFSALATDTSYKTSLSTLNSHIQDAYNSGPQEMAQIHSGPNGPVWGDKPSYTGALYQGAYWNDLFLAQLYDGATGGTHIMGMKTQHDPYGYIDGPAEQPGTSYQGVALGPMRGFAAIMYLMPEIRSTVNYPALFEYLDRVDSHGLQTGGDLCVTPDSRENPATCDAYRNQGCVYYGVTWGPVEPNNMQSDCIKKVTPPYTKVGRFTSLDGSKVDKGYASWQVEDNWTIIRSDGASAAASFKLIPPAGFQLKQ